VLEEIARNWWHIPILMGMILIYGWLLNRAFFRPVQGVLEERKRRIQESSSLSAMSQETLKARYLEYDQAVLEAHRRATRVKEEARNQALQTRSEVLGSVKAEVDRDLRRREAELSANVAEVKRALEKEIPQVSRLLAGKILGREVAL